MIAAPYASRRCSRFWSTESSANRFISAFSSTHMSDRLTSNALLSNSRKLLTRSFSG